MENEVQNESVRPEETAAPVAAEPQEPAAAQTEPAAAQTEPAPAEEPAAQPAEEKREENARPRPEPVPVTEEMLENSKKILATMLDYLGLEGTVKAEGKPGKINLLIASDDAGRIIGRKGQSLESLQVLVNRIMQKGHNDTVFGQNRIIANALDIFDHKCGNGQKMANVRRCTILSFLIAMKFAGKQQSLIKTFCQNHDASP